MNANRDHTSRLLTFDCGYANDGREREGTERPTNESSSRMVLSVETMDMATTIIGVENVSPMGPSSAPVITWPQSTPAGGTRTAARASIGVRTYPSITWSTVNTVSTATA